MNPTIDILMITYNRPKYTAISLKRLLETCDETMRVWVWHNGMDLETLEVVQSHRSHPRFYRFYHSQINKKLNEPTNWLWENAQGEFYSKVDDDCAVPYGWAETLRDAHVHNPSFGVIGCWHYLEEDIVPELVIKKVQRFEGGHQVMRNCWYGGSGYLMKRECYELLGPLRTGQSFTQYCIALARRGFVNGIYYPFLYQDHFDDPRSKHTQIKTDEDVRRWAPLSAIYNGIDTVEKWKALLMKDALNCQSAPYDPKYYSGWRSVIKKVGLRIQKMLGNKQKW